MGIRRRVGNFLSDIGENISFTVSDAAESLLRNADGRGASLLLNRFSESDVRRLMKKSGMVGLLSSRGLSELRYRIFSDDTLIHHLEVYDGRFSDDSLIIDLRLSERRFAPGNNLSYDLFQIEWLMARDPNVKDFSVNRLQLPGQSAPGLGLLDNMVRLMRLASVNVLNDGFVNIPDHLHLALMYSRYFHFYDPRKEGFLRAMLRDLKSSGLYNIAWAAVTGSICERGGGVIKYVPGEQIFPASRRMKKYFSSGDYIRAVKDSMKRRLSIDYDRLEKERKKMISDKRAGKR